MPPKFLIDTDVIIDYLRGNNHAVKYLESINNPQSVSCITVAELYVGLRDQGEKTTLDQILHLFDVIDINEDIAKLGGIFRRDYGKSHGTSLPDALIAATCVIQNLQLQTLNTKHFPMLDIKPPYKSSRRGLAVPVLSHHRTCSSHTAVSHSV